MVVHLLPAFVLLAVLANPLPLASQLRDGDIIFQESRSAQSQAIQIATRSRYSHMGLITRWHGEWFVYEAVQPVKLTPLPQWIRRGSGGHFVVKRLRDQSLLTPKVRSRMKTEAERYRGKPYDSFFQWSDDRIYCSELVWKVYKGGAGIELGALQHLRDFDLSNRLVRAKLKERYGSRIPLEEPVISPARIFESDKLMDVVRK